MLSIGERWEIRFLRKACARRQTRLQTGSKRRKRQPQDEQVRLLFHVPLKSLFASAKANNGRDAIVGAGAAAGDPLSERDDASASF